MNYFGSTLRETIKEIANLEKRYPTARYYIIDRGITFKLKYMRFRIIRLTTHQRSVK